MGLPLQPQLRPWPYWLRRVLLISLVLICILILGLFQRPITYQQEILDNQQNHYLHTVSQKFKNANDRIWCMLYVIRRGNQDTHPVNYLSRLLVEAKSRGVDVRVIFDHSDPEATYPGPDNSPSINYFRAHGIPAHYDELDKTSHAKVLLIDDDLIIGSHNWTSWALTKNREISMLSNDPRMRRHIEHTFQKLFNKGTSDDITNSNLLGRSP